MSLVMPVPSNGSVNSASLNQPIKVQPSFLGAVGRVMLSSDVVTGSTALPPLLLNVIV